MSFEITDIIKCIVYLLFLIFAGILIPLVKRKLSDAQRENLSYWVDVAVMAAEGIFKQSGMGEAKYNYVISFLEKKGFKINADEIKALIESSVYELINQFKDAGSSEGVA